MDLGCGTGLMAEAIRDRVEAIDGVDVSAAMVSQARGRGLYRDLAAGEMIAVLAGKGAERYDLILAADVLVYVADCESLFRAVAHAPAGRALRLHHAILRWRGLAARRRPAFSPVAFLYPPDGKRDRFEVRVMADCVVRLDRGQPCAGHGFVLGKADG